MRGRVCVDVLSGFVGVWSCLCGCVVVACRYLEVSGARKGKQSGIAKGILLFNASSKTKVSVSVSVSVCVGE